MMFPENGTQKKFTPKSPFTPEQQRAIALYFLPCIKNHPVYGHHVAAVCADDHADDLLFISTNVNNLSTILEPLGDFTQRWRLSTSISSQAEGRSTVTDVFRSGAG